MFSTYIFSCPVLNYILSSSKAFEGTSLLRGKRLITDLSDLKIQELILIEC